MVPAEFALTLTRVGCIVVGLDRSAPGRRLPRTTEEPSVPWSGAVGPVRLEERPDCAGGSGSPGAL